MLKDIVPVKRKIKVDEKNDFEVQGLTLEALMKVFGENQVMMNKLFNGEMGIAHIIVAAPMLAASLIAEASGEPDAVEQARLLPAGIQALALEDIWDLTVAREDDIKKLFGRLDELGKSLGLQVPQVSGDDKKEQKTSGKEKSATQ